MLLVAFLFAMHAQAIGRAEGERRANLLPRSFGADMAATLH